MIFLDTKYFNTKGGIVIPNIDFITTLLNVTTSDIKKCNVRTKQDTVYYELTLVRKPMDCPFCGGSMIGHGQKLKVINHPILREQKGVIHYYANRYICKDCRRTAFEKNPFAFEGFNASFLLLQNAMRLLGNLGYNLQMISEELHISPTQLNKYLDSYVTIPKRPLPECLGIDEIYNKYLSKRNSSYLCILVDNVNRQIHDILDSRSKQSLSLYFSTFPRSERLKVRYVTIDMWKPYKDVSKIYFPNALIAVDPFHVVKHLTDAFQRLRIDLMRQCEYDSNAYYLLKKWHWLLMTDHVNLDNARVYNSRFSMKLNRRDLFNMLMDAFPTLELAYALKEEYRQFNKDSTYEEAVKRFDILAKKFKNSGIAQFDAFIGILSNWREEILNSFLRPYQGRKLSNAFTEHINGKIETYLSISRGVNNFQRFRKRVIYALSPDVHYALTGCLQSEKVPKKKRGSYNKPRD